MSRPAPESNTTESATSTTTRAPRIRPARPPATARAALLLQRFAQIDARDLQRRRKSEQQAGRRRDAQGECQHPPIDAAFGKTRNVAWRERHQGVRAPLGEEQAGRAGHHSQHQAFGDQLAHDAAAAGAYRGANGDLPRTRSGPREQQIRYIRARDQQHQRHRSQQQVECQPDIADHVVAHAGHGHRLAGIAIRILPLETRADRRHLGLRLPLQVSRIDLNDALKQGAARAVAGGRAGRMRGALVVVEVALSVVLLSGAGLLIRSLWPIGNVALGFRPEHILVMESSVRPTSPVPAALPASIRICWRILRRSPAFRQPPPPARYPVASIRTAATGSIISQPV